MNTSPRRYVQSPPSTTPTLAAINGQPSIPPSVEIVRITPSDQVLDASSLLSTPTAVSGQEAEATSEHDLVESILNHDTRIRQYFRYRFWKQHPAIAREASFEDVFGPPRDRVVATDPAQAARDLEECCMLYRLIRSPSCTPMDRWLQASPSEEAVHVECLRCSRAERESVSNARQTTLAPVRTDHDEIHHDERNDDNSVEASRGLDTSTSGHDRSWFEPGDSAPDPADASSLANGVSTARNSTPQPRDPALAEMIRAIISTFDTVDR